MSTSGGGAALALYRGLSGALSPAASLFLKRRAARGKEDVSRLSERRGHASRVRLPGTLIWIHGASVGESLAALPLTTALLQKPGRHVLMTTGTLTSAKLMADRLPPNAFHQFVPLDVSSSVRRFLDHWRPDLALFVESELWPNLVLETRARGVPMALVNGRFSERSAQRWRYARGLSRRLLSAFDECLVQDADVAARLTALGARVVQVTGNLKADAPPLPVDQSALAAFRVAVGTRPIFLAASTHPGEEDIVLDVAQMLRHEGLDALTVIVPRHPDRGEAIAQLAGSRGLGVRRRTSGTLPDAGTDIYVADTLGELGLFYSAAPFAFLGGSLVPHGGQNPLEPARFGMPVLTGPHTENFAQTFDVLLKAQGAGLVTSAPELFSIVLEFCRVPGLAADLGTRTKAAAESLGGALAKTVETAERLLLHARA